MSVLDLHVSLQTPEVLTISANKSLAFSHSVGTDACSDRRVARVRCYEFVLLVEWSAVKIKQQN